MKKILSILGTITLIGTSTTSLVSCNTPQYTEKELADLKEQNKINTKDGILEWIAPQEKPFNQVDNKYYFVVVGFLKQLNSIIFYYPAIKEQISINNLQIFNKNNEKLLLITLEI
ncbi:hypothetical protein P344_03200 [Spiroplasma mirum ATCC 29335]|uniref:Lipoprotein n=1 Tax=Spiroplasma mirum ATCC 29335 TaxID=838561 RepID=W0GQQ9_9MOLU|nr:MULTISPECIES: lipoprotein [Spiroplasma]AHF60969.1 putative lipoprotein [Spiroplasma mirum ATCC 29335]AHI57984.1 hypothetical protein P344_03200 [Spiroplasma mirum ATCC 29335]AKM53070.1 hypothetical protein SATRI_v1c05960 [Spiroplasma atrichopogonis]